MNSQRLVATTRFLIDRLGKEEAQSCLNAMEQEFKELIENSTPTDYLCTVEQMQELLFSIDPSHWEGAFSNISLSERLLFFALAPESYHQFFQAENLKRPIPILTEEGRAFAMKQLLQAFQKTKQCPTKHTNFEDPLERNLLSIFPEHTVAFLRLLAMHDLHSELKYVIRSEQRLALENFLTEDELLFLREINRKPQLLSFKAMNLASWDLTESTLEELLVKRGINRLAKATLNKSPDWLYNLSLQLPLKQAELLRCLQKFKEDQSIISQLMIQVNETLEAFKGNLVL